MEQHYAIEKHCPTIPLPTNYHEEEDDDEDDDNSSCDQKQVEVAVGKIKPSISSTRLHISPNVMKNTPAVVVQPPAIQTYSPQLNLSLYSPSIPSSTLSKATTVPSPLAAITMDIRSPPQPTPSTSRFKSAFQRLRGSSFSKNSSTVVPLDLPPLKPSKSSSLAEKIKNKFHHHQSEKKKKRETKKVSSMTENTMPRSASLSSITSRLTKKKKNTNMVHSTSMASGIASFPKYKQDTRLSQPLRAVNHHVSAQKGANKKKGGVKFAKLVSVRDTYSKEEYNRCSDPEAICNRLTADMAQQVKEELNAFKLHEMPVHEYSRGNTHFFI
ncbi:hypothetical protein K501DRAFT_250247 [Backusella circina FSU 941]|nr:hypothetical protein K501DRAFT_250247 [Backusella circina FSU 941]